MCLRTDQYNQYLFYNMQLKKNVEEAILRNLVQLIIPLVTPSIEIIGIVCGMFNYQILAAE